MNSTTAQILQEARAQCLSGQIEEAHHMVQEYASNFPEVFEALYFLSRIPIDRQFWGDPKNRQFSYQECALLAAHSSRSPEQSILLCDVAETSLYLSKEVAEYYLLKAHNNKLIPDFIIDEINQNEDLDLLYCINIFRFFLSWDSISPFDDPLMYGGRIWNNISLSLQNYTMGYFMQKYQEQKYINYVNNINPSEHYPFSISTIVRNLHADFRLYYTLALYNCRSESMLDHCSALIANSIHTH